MKDLILHSLKMHKVQTISVTLSVALSVMALFALVLVYGGVQGGVQLNAERSGAQIMVVPTEAAAELSGEDLLFTGAPASYYLSDEVAQRVAGTEGVTRMSSQFFGQTLDASCCSVDTASRLIGVDFTTDWTIQPFAHIDIPDHLAADEVIVGASTNGNVGDTITLLDNQYTVVDRLEPSGSDLDFSILLDIDVVRDICGASDGLAYLWDKYGDPHGLVSCILVDYEDESQYNRLITRLGNIDGVRVLERSALVSEAQGQLETVFFILLGAGVLMLISTLVQLFARFYSCVWDRKSELALYRAIGANRGQLRKLIGGEVAVIVAIGLVAGLILGVILYQVLIGMLQNGTAFPFAGLSVGAIVGVGVAFVVVFALIALAAIAVPLSQLGRLEPSLVMQQGDID
ncbi:MAG: ABC transporter permease [Eggerthellaceae bacterium]|nr:ABC transporter permease [Eggerthellaceae bacterium]